MRNLASSLICASFLLVAPGCGGDDDDDDDTPDSAAADAAADSGGGGADMSSGADAGGGAADAAGDAPEGAITVFFTIDRTDFSSSMSEFQITSVTTTGFTLMAPGSCAGAADCGHYHIYLDDTLGTYLYVGSESAPGDAIPIDANGPVAAGPHTILLSLVNDDHSFLDPPIEASIAVTMD